MQQECISIYGRNAFEYDSQALVFSHLMVIYPNADESELISAVNSLGDGELAEISEIIFQGHNHHDLMRNPSDIRGPIISYESSLAFLRDLNRHRAFGRTVLMTLTPNFEGVINRGWNRNHAIHESVYWSEFAQEWEADFEELYDDIAELDQFMSRSIGENYDRRILINILPLGHQSKMLMSGPTSQIAYMTSLRIGLGGDFGYRNDVWNMFEAFKEMDPGYAHMNDHLNKPDVNSAEQIAGRS
jgi:hypothetical protein